MATHVKAAMAQPPTGDAQIVAGVGSITGALALLVGWLILLLPASRGPTVGWVLAHAVLFGGVALLIPAVLGMRRLLHAAQAREGDIAVGLALLGALTLAGQYAIDLAVAQVAADHAAMADLLIGIAAAPAMAIAFYSVGPAGLYVGLGMLAMGLRESRRVPILVAMFVVVGVIGAGVGRVMDSGVVTLLGHAVACAGLLPIGWIMLRGYPPPRQAGAS